MLTAQNGGLPPFCISAYVCFRRIRRGDLCVNSLFSQSFGKAKTDCPSGRLRTFLSA